MSIVLPEIPREAPRPENIPLDVLYQDEHLVVVNKPPGMVVHPARGHWSGTLASALQFHFGPTLSTTGGLSRPGIVHRLDRDTSGVILVARNDQAHSKLAKQFAARSIEKEYFALVCGCPAARSRLHRLPDRLPSARAREDGHSPRPSESRPAQTFYEVLERFDGFAAVRLLPKTGRTHQIRVHLNHIGCPVLCDRQYGGRSQITRGEIRRDPADATVLLERQALHARRLRFAHPATGEPLEIEAPLPGRHRGRAGRVADVSQSGKRALGETPLLAAVSDVARILLDKHPPLDDNRRSPDGVDRTLSCREDVAVPGFLSQIDNDPVVGRFRARKVVAFVLAASMLVGSAGSGWPLLISPAMASADEANAFNTLAAEIEKSVTELGYPKEVAQDLVRLVRDWKCEVWQQTLSQARQTYQQKQISAADVARVEEEVIQGLSQTIGREIAPCRAEEDLKYFYLSKVVKDKKAQCLGYAQLVYILGNSLGLRVTADRCSGVGFWCSASRK